MVPTGQFLRGDNMLISKVETEVEDCEFFFLGGEQIGDPEGQHRIRLELNPNYE